MANQIEKEANIEAMERLRRNSEQLTNVTEVTCVGGGISVWPIKVKSHVSHNIYDVCGVMIGETGSEPVEFGEELEAINLSESFIEQGGAAIGKYAVMFKAGQRRIFYCQV